MLFQIPPLAIPLLVSLQLCPLAWAQATLLPPSTFGGETSTGPASSSASSSATPTITADFPSLSGYSSCVTNCMAMGSAAANCTSMVDINCFCVSKRFTKEIVDCITAGCPQELATAESLAQQFCNVASNATSLSFPTPTFTSTTTSLTTTTSRSNSTSNTPTSTTPGTTTSQSPPASNAALSGLKRGRGTVGAPIFYAMGVGLLGRIFGAYLIE